MSHVRSATTTEIIKDASVPVSDAYGAIIFQTNDSVKASAGANSSLKVLLSVLELLTNGYHCNSGGGIVSSDGLN